jgi:hypothetical protein
VIGHLQTNKARLVARFAAEFQALDSLRVAEALDRRLQAEGRSLEVFVQVNTSGEASKYGLSPEGVPAFIQALPAFSALRVRGLMTLALFSSDTEGCASASCGCAACATGCAKAPRGHRAGRTVDGHVRRFRDRHRGRCHRGARRPGHFWRPPFARQPLLARRTQHRGVATMNTGMAIHHLDLEAPIRTGQHRHVSASASSRTGFSPCK